MISCEFENGNKASLRHVTTAVFVLDGDKILLGRRAEHLLEGGKWGPLGGFLDRDETMEEGVVREAMEESGYTISLGPLFYVSDNPDRPGENRQNLNFVYLADVGAKMNEKDGEMQELHWFPLLELPSDDQIAFDFSIPLKLLIEYRENPFPLPRFWKRV